MSQVDDHIAALAHMDGALAAMRAAVDVMSRATEDAAGKLAELWGTGNDVAGTVHGQMAAAKDHLDNLDKFLMGAQVEAVHAMLLFSRVAGT